MHSLQAPIPLQPAIGIACGRRSGPRASRSRRTGDCDTRRASSDRRGTTRDRAWRRPPPGSRARLLAARRRRHYDCTLLKAFAAALGVYPPGTVVQLENQEVGVVLRANRDPSLIDRPLVQILLDERGRPYGTVRTVDVATRDAHGFVTTIRSALAAQPRGLAAARVFLGAL